MCAVTEIVVCSTEVNQINDLPTALIADFLPTYLPCVLRISSFFISLDCMAIAEPHDQTTFPELDNHHLLSS